MKTYSLGCFFFLFQYSNPFLSFLLHIFLSTSTSLTRCTSKSKRHNVRQECDVTNTQSCSLNETFLWARPIEGASNGQLSHQTLKTKSCHNCSYVILVKMCMSTKRFKYVNLIFLSKYGMDTYGH